MLLIVSALRQEISDFKRHLTLAVTLTIGPFRFYKGSLGTSKEEIGLLLTTVGPEPQALARVIHYIHGQFGITRAILTGFAGALQPGLVAGELVLASEFLRGGSKNGDRIPSDALLLTELRDCLADLVLLYTQGPLVTLDRAVVTSAEKAALGSESAALMVDMEGFHLASILSKEGIPFVGIRSIFDPIALELSPVICRLVDSQGHFRCGKGVTLLAHPKELLQLPLFAKNAAKARSSIARFLLHFA